MRAKPRRERRKQSLEDELRSLNAIYRWDRMPSSPRSSSNPPKESLRAGAGPVPFDSVTKRSRRRRRRGQIGTDSSIVNLESSGWLPTGCGDTLDETPGRGGGGNVLGGLGRIEMVSSTASAGDRARADSPADRCDQQENDGCRGPNDERFFEPSSEQVASVDGRGHSKGSDGHQHHEQGPLETAPSPVPSPPYQGGNDFESLDAPSPPRPPPATGSPMSLGEFDGGDGFPDDGKRGRARRRSRAATTTGACERLADTADSEGGDDDGEVESMGDGYDSSMASEEDAHDGVGSVVHKRPHPAEHAFHGVAYAGGGVGDRSGAANASDSNAGFEGSTGGGGGDSSVDGGDPESMSLRKLSRGGRPRARRKRRVILEDDSDDGQEGGQPSASLSGPLPSSSIDDGSEDEGRSDVSKMPSAAAVEEEPAYTTAGSAGGASRLPRRRHRVLMDEDSDSDGSHGCGGDGARRTAAADAAAPAAPAAVAAADSVGESDTDDAAVASRATVSPVGEDGINLDTKAAGHTDKLFESSDLADSGRLSSPGVPYGGDGGVEWGENGCSSGEEGYGSPDAEEEWNLSRRGDESNLSGGDEGTAARERDPGTGGGCADVLGGDVDKVCEGSGAGECAVGGAESEPGPDTEVPGGSCADGTLLESDEFAVDPFRLLSRPCDDGEDGDFEDGSDDDNGDVVVRPRSRSRSAKGKAGGRVARGTRRKIVVESESEPDFDPGVFSPTDDKREDERREDRGFVRSRDSDLNREESSSSSSNSGGGDNNGHETIGSPASSEAGSCLPRRRCGRRARKFIVDDDDSSSSSSSRSSIGIAEDAVDTPSSGAVTAVDEGFDAEEDSFSVALSPSDDDGHEGSCRQDTSRGGRRTKRLPSAASASPSESEAAVESEGWAGSSSSAFSSPEPVATPEDRVRRGSAPLCCGTSDDGDFGVDDDDDDDDDSWVDEHSAGGLCPKTPLGIGKRRGRRGSLAHANIEDDDSDGGDSGCRSSSLSPCVEKTIPATKTKKTKGGVLSCDKPRWGREAGGSGAGRGGGVAEAGRKGRSGDAGGGGHGDPGQDKLQGVAFARARDRLTAKYFAEFNDGVFGGALSAVKVTWSPRLSTTAGVTKSLRRGNASGGFTYVSAVELSTKVLDTESKLQQTLLHELCHAAAWVVDHISKPPHGDHFWAWANRAKAAHPGVPVTTCHSYSINYKYRYMCIGGGSVESNGAGGVGAGGGCGAEIGRHSKSIDVDRQVCGRCKGRLALFGTHGKDGKLKKPRAASGFSLFVKERYAEVKGALPPGTRQQQVMKEMSRQWASRGNVGGDAAAKLGIDNRASAACPGAAGSQIVGDAPAKRSGGETVAAALDKENSSFFDLT